MRARLRSAARSGRATCTHLGQRRSNAGHSVGYDVKLDDESDGAQPGDVQDLARVGARVNLIGEVEADLDRARNRCHRHRDGPGRSDAGRAGAMARTLRRIIAWSAVAIAAIALALLLAARPPGGIHDPGGLEQRQNEQQRARDRHGT